jgi:hypothetical protein
MAELLAKRAKALGHKPRPVDISGWLAEARRDELEFLRGCAAPVCAAVTSGSPLRRTEGADERNANAVLSLTELHEAASRLGAGAGLERSRVVCTTFKRGTAGKDVVCAAEAAAGGLSFVMLRQSDRWPAREIVLIPVGLDGKPSPLRDVSAACARTEGDIRLWYRVTGCSDWAEGRGEDTALRAELSARVLAAAVGPAGRPRFTWVRGLSGIE